jgi:putative phosphoesterase
MKVGVVSDTHGRVAALQLALDLLRGRGAEAIMHCGDIGRDCMEALGIFASSAPGGVLALAVAGNIDYDLDDLAADARVFGVAFNPQMIVLPLGGGKFLAATHGNDPALLRKLISCGEYDYVCHGHTHVAADHREGRTRVINPGALFAPRGGRPPTVALLDSETDELEFVRLR